MRRIGYLNFQRLPVQKFGIRSCFICGYSRQK